MGVTTPDNITPGAIALARVNQAVSAAAIFPIIQGATIMRVCAVSKDILVHWAKVNTDYCTAENFDDIVAVGSTQDITIPTGDCAFVSFLNQASGGTVVAVQK